YLLLLITRPPASSLHPYTTLFRSNTHVDEAANLVAVVAAEVDDAVVFGAAAEFSRILSGWPGHEHLFHLSHHGSADAVGVLQDRSEEHTSELQSRENLVCRLLLGK